MVNEKSREFVKSLLNFYKDFLGKSAGAIKNLADLERDFKEEYGAFKNASKNPIDIKDLMEKLDLESQQALLVMFMDSASLSSRMSRLYDLSEDEKRALSNDLIKFAGKMDIFIKNLEIKRKEAVKSG